MPTHFGECASATVMEQLAAHGTLNVNAKINASASGAEIRAAISSPILGATAAEPETAPIITALGVDPPANNAENTPTADSLTANAQTQAVNVSQPIPKIRVTGSIAIPMA